ncbi:unnamed protein product [Boreogadus saida]
MEMEHHQPGCLQRHPPSHLQHHPTSRQPDRQQLHCTQQHRPQEESTTTDLLTYVMAMREKMEEMSSLVRDNLQDAQDTQTRWKAFDQVKKDLAALSIPSLRYGVAHPATLLITYKGKRHSFDAVRTAEDFVKELRGQQHGECG